MNMNPMGYVVSVLFQRFAVQLRYLARRVPGYPDYVRKKPTPLQNVSQAGPISSKHVPQLLPSCAGETGPAPKSIVEYCIVATCTCVPRFRSHYEMNDPRPLVRMQVRDPSSAADLEVPSRIQFLPECITRDIESILIRKRRLGMSSKVFECYLGDALLPP